MRVLIAVSTLVVAGFALNAEVSAFPSNPQTAVTIMDPETVEPGYVLYPPLLGDPSQGLEPRLSSLSLALVWPDRCRGPDSHPTARGNTSRPSYRYPKL